MRGKEGNCEPWVPESGLTEGCPSSPGLFNLYHHSAMRLARKEREKKAAEDGRTAGIVMKWLPGCALLAVNRWGENVQKQWQWRNRYLRTSQQLWGSRLRSKSWEGLRSTTMTGKRRC